MHRRMTPAERADRAAERDARAAALTASHLRDPWAGGGLAASPTRRSARAGPARAEERPMMTATCPICPDPEPHWHGSPDPTDPDNAWIDDVTGERVDARTGERTPPR